MRKIFFCYITIFIRLGDLSREIKRPSNLDYASRNMLISFKYKFYSSNNFLKKKKCTPKTIFSILHNNIFFLR